MTDETGRRTAALHIPWSWIGIGSAVIAIGSLGTLAVVATVTGADTLSTVALALAVLAFVIQILTFVAQSWVTMQQNHMSQALNAETRGMLAELRTRSQDTNSILNEQYNKLLDQMLAVTKDTVKEASSENTFDFSELQTRLASDLQRVVEEARDVPVDTRHRALGHSGDPGPAARSRLRSQRTWPAERLIERLAEAGMAELDTSHLNSLKEFADDYVESVRTGVPDGYYMDSSQEDEQRFLMKKGFLKENTEISPHPESELPMLMLTSKGRAAARLLTARGPSPAKVKELLPNVAAFRGD